MLGIFLDTESNGLNPFKHTLLEIAFKILDLSTGKLIDEYQSIIWLSEEEFKKSNLKSLKINGFSYEMIKTGKKSENVEQEVITTFKKNNINNKTAVFICQNPSFDRSFFSKLIEQDRQEALLWPYHWLDLASMFWALAIKKATIEKSPLPWKIGISKDQIAANYNLKPEKLPHRAMNGVDHLLVCYKAVVGFPNLS